MPLQQHTWPNFGGSLIQRLRSFQFAFPISPAFRTVWRRRTVLWTWWSRCALLSIQNSPVVLQLGMAANARFDRLMIQNYTELYMQNWGMVINPLRCTHTPSFRQVSHYGMDDHTASTIRLHGWNSLHFIARMFPTGTTLVGGLVAIFFPEILGCIHHPNWRTHIFQDGVAQRPTKQYLYHQKWLFCGKGTLVKFLT